ncbi:MAG: NAD-dependent epimerase/dehydratase family protein, partial [Verrucomicrobiota bacterium]|nr:NAD-dependent epimerase/dehydratase family protein [Verrucomicrobiota bacterium]
MANHEIVLSTACPSDSFRLTIVLYEHYTMRILITGGSGFIGRSLQRSLRARGDSVVTLGRDSRSDFQWDFSNAPINPKALADIDAVIHLAGENVGSGRWTAA